MTRPAPSAPAPRSWLTAAVAASAFVPAAALIGITGAVINQGHDALALSLGLSGGAFLWAAGLTPPRGAAAYLASRYESPAVGRFAIGILALAFLMLMAAELTALTGGLAALAPSLPLSPLAAMTALLVAGSLLHQAAGARAYGLAATAIPLAVVALLAGLAALSGQDGPGVVVSVPTLADIGSLERSLLDKRLADPGLFKPFASPYLRTDLLNTLTVIGCLSLGIAILASARSCGSIAADHAARFRCRAATLSIAALVVVPALAASARRTLLAVVDTGIKSNALPDWMTNLASSAALQVCGAPPESSVDALVKACGKGAGPLGLMRWQDFVFAPDSVLMAALVSRTGAMLATAAALLLLVAAYLAAMATARAAAAALYTNPGTAPSPGDDGPVALLAITIAAWLLAAGVTALDLAPSATLLTWSATLAAAGLAPALVMAACVSRPSPRSSLIALPLGAGVALILILVSRYDALDGLAFTTAAEQLSPSAMRKLSTLFVALGNAQGEPARAAIMAKMQDLARDNISWLGLKPLAAGAWGMAVGALVMIIGQAIAAAARLRRQA